MNHVTIRLYLGYVNPDAPEEAMFRFGSLFPGFTSYFARGHWHGESESTLVLEVVVRGIIAHSVLSGEAVGVSMHPRHSREIRDFAAWYRKAWGQEAVLLTATPTHFELLEGRAP